MATDLTVNERAFAELIVQGSKSAAYRTVYSARGSQATQATNAYKLSRKPKIKTEVARLLQQRAFPADDYKRLQETAIAGMTEIFLRDPDSRVRLKAGSILSAYADAGLKLHPEPSAKERVYDSSERTAIIAEFKRIYAEAGITSDVKDVACKYSEAMESEPEHGLIADAAEQEAGSLMEVAAGTEPESGEDEAPEPEPAMAEGSFIAEHRTPAIQFRLEAIPGYFPAKYRRVPIQP